ncbi:type II toxin-antitoxin system PemK/MazF family toxin [Streptomyces sp. AP-93]|uniref:type II toxin-antitoxin system PemK/MazF family toxin n=1 Tax=Streptomyces sp. AP-93 TaxID=2929048 RepID=UPI001FAE8BEA|nr:type II toxin-antitoxin system PemK/MazF family toxin [Streptomyces sp. AP-93]MCJ0872290.1 type II toxin-antitoxin system PemK/MazF family toxin [Streptomyces sp. AP-93]
MSRLARPWQVWYADLSPVIGSEQAGRRPVLVVASPTHAAFPIPMTIIVPLTTKTRGLDHHVPINSPESGLDRPSWARTDDIRSISEQRLVGHTPLGVVSDKERNEVRLYLRLMLDL